MHVREDIHERVHNVSLAGSNYNTTSYRGAVELARSMRIIRCYIPVCADCLGSPAD